MATLNKDPRYPIGKFAWPTSVSANERTRCIDNIASQPKRLRDAVSGLSEEQIGTPYRIGGWTVRQLLHHVPESHMNSYIRFKLALTEIDPVIKPYEEAAWAALRDVAETPLDISLCLLDCLHARWVVLLRCMSEMDWERRFLHPELGPVRLDSNLALYSWHGDHHIAHVTELRRRKGWRD